MYLSFKNAREPIDSYTHFLGAIFFLAGTVVLLMRAALSNHACMTSIASCAIFGASLIALYGASSIYHYYNRGDEKKLFRLRKLDHSMIYVLIAGTYTPICLNYIGGTTGVWFTIGMWTAALVGIVLKIFFFHVPRFLYTALYIAMGWAIVLDFPAVLSIPTGGLILLVAGGVIYTAGGVIYALKRPNLSDRFGFHELFHIFVFFGSLCHFFFILFYIV